MKPDTLLATARRLAAPSFSNGVGSFRRIFGTTEIQITYRKVGAPDYEISDATRVLASGSRKDVTPCLTRLLADKAGKWAGRRSEPGAEEPMAPAPSLMAREAYVDEPDAGERARGLMSEARIHYAAGVRAERMRVADLTPERAEQERRAYASGLVRAFGDHERVRRQLDDAAVAAFDEDPTAPH